MFTFQRRVPRLEIRSAVKYNKENAFVNFMSIKSFAITVMYISSSCYSFHTREEAQSGTAVNEITL